MQCEGGAARRGGRSSPERGALLRAALYLGLALAGTSKGQELEAQRLDGKRVTGRFTALDPDGLKLSSGGTEQRIALDELVSLAFEAAAQAVAPALAELELSNGLVLRGLVKGGAGEELVLQIGGHGELRLPYGIYRRVEILARTAGRGAITPAEEGTDRIYRVVGEALDVLDGIVTGYDEANVLLEDAAGRERKVPWNEVAALLFGSAEASWPVPDHSATVRLRDGSAARGALRADAAGGIALALGDALRLDFAASEVWSVEIHGPAFVRLGELAPARSDVQPFFADGPTPFFVLDRGIYGAPLRVGGKSFARGIALRPICDLTYDVGGAYRRFQARVGIDDASEPERHRHQSWYGSVRFRIEVDGREAWSSPVVRAGEAALEVPPLDLTGAKSIALKTDFADGFPAGDLPVWLEPILVK